MHIFENYSHEYKTRRILELWIKSCYLETSAQHAQLWKTDADQVDTISKPMDPGKFKDEKKWPDWEPAFVNYLYIFPGVKGVPLPMWFNPVICQIMEQSLETILWHEPLHVHH